MLDDGLGAVDGHLEVPVDEYGSFGRLFPNSVFDWFDPVGESPDYPSYLAGAFLFVTTGGQTSSILLSEYDQWFVFLEGPPNEDGLAGNHTNLARTITTPIAGNGTTATSAFEVTATEFAVHVDLTQSVTSTLATATSVLAQVYTFRNDGSTPVDLVFHAVWEPDLYFSMGTANNYVNDIVGVVPGLCAVYTHNPNTTSVAVLLGYGAGTTLTTPPYYYAGKAGDTPPTSSDPLVALSAPDANQYIWLQHGMPVGWRNYATGPGYNMAGDSGTLQADASMGMEWHFTLAPGASETIDVRRHYGTISVPCPAASTCGNGVVDTASGELCDGADTPTCNGATCMASVCGDGYANAAAGEQCDSGGVDSETCNGVQCTESVCGDGHPNMAAGEQCDDGGETAACNADCTPAACGDGIVNAAAGEECETGELCDVTTCTVAFTVGGGCAGCGTSSDGRSSLWLAGIVVALSVRRRRRARAA